MYNTRVVQPGVVVLALRLASHPVHRALAAMKVRVVMDHDCPLDVDLCCGTGSAVVYLTEPEVRLRFPNWLGVYLHV